MKYIRTACSEFTTKITLL